jgi:hypothetical protein
MLPPSSLLQSVLVAMELWTGAQCAFAVKAFYKNSYSFPIAQREFRREYGIHHNRAVPSVYAIKTWVQNFEATGSTLKMKGGSVKTAHTPGCPKSAFDGFCTKISTTTPIKFKLFLHYMSTTMKTVIISARLFCN